MALTQIATPGNEPNWPEIRILLLASFALLVFLAVVNWLVAWRLARQARVCREVARVQMELVRAALPRSEGEDPHAALCRILSRVTGQGIDGLTPLAGSAAPPYLLLREDNTRRRLLLAGAGSLERALRAAGIRRRPPRKQRRTIRPSVDGPLVLEEIAAAWAALAPGLGLPGETPAAGSWELAMLPPEEIE